MSAWVAWGAVWLWVGVYWFLRWTWEWAHSPHRHSRFRYGVEYNRPPDAALTEGGAGT